MKIRQKILLPLLAMGFLHGIVIGLVWWQCTMELKGADTSVLQMILVVAAFAEGGMLIAVEFWFDNALTKRINRLLGNYTRLHKKTALSPLDPAHDELGAMDARFRELATVLESTAKQGLTLAENAKDIICTMTTDYKVVQLNPAGRKLWEINDDAPIPLNRLMHPHDLIQMTNALQRSRDTSLSSANHEARNVDLEARSTDGNLNPVWLHWSVRWSDGEQSFSCVAQDITERKQLELQKTDFLHMVTHDLRTPLQAMDNFLEIMDAGKYGNLNESGKLAVEKLQQTTATVTRLVDKILLVEAEAEVLHITTVQLKDTINGVVDSIQPVAETKTVQIVVENLAEPAIQADKERIAQVLQNLLANAVRHSPPGGTVTVQLEETNSGTIAVVKVSDQGKGIGPELQSEIFDKFNQIGVEKKSNEFGLGLAISKYIIQKHGGTIGVDSDGKTGSTFWFKIPISHVAS